MDKVQKTAFTYYNAPLSEHFRLQNAHTLVRNRIGDPRVHRAYTALYPLRCIMHYCMKHRNVCVRVFY
jgi:hypothetical protein